ncbi:MAG: dienelactone hydrolase [Candidatus Latescibacterota bacterium]|jgi:dienelactone hydrolase
MRENMLGSYGRWANGLVGGQPARLSFCNERFKSLSAWKKKAVAKAEELLAEPNLGGDLIVSVEKQYEYDGLHVEELSWQLPMGPRTKAVFFKPAVSKGKLPAVLALHDHGGRKYFGLRKIARLPGRRHPLIVEHQREHYSDLGWANELAKRGYAVLVHDAFLFGSRRIRYGEVPATLRRGRKENNPETRREVLEYNDWAGAQESVVAKSLFCAGTTWPGVFLAEDRKAFSYLCTRRDVDADRVGCGGLSGGGLRTVFLAGMDKRVKAAVCMGFMSTWQDFLLHKSYTHTWMTYLPLMPREMDFPEILGLRVPLPTLVQNCNEDSLYTMEGMRAADAILRSVYDKAGAAEQYEARFYPGGHKFDIEMQADAFSWWDEHLKK